MKEKRSIRLYSEEEKLSIVASAIKGEMSKYGLSKKYGITRGTLYSWIRIFAPEHSNSGVMSKIKKESSESEEVRQLKQALREKELELYRSKMETAVYKELVAIAKEDFGLDLSKKDGTKQ